MAFYSDTDDEDLENPQGPAAGGAFIDGAGSAGAPAAAAGAASTPKTPDNPGHFVGIKNYLDQNKNQAAKLGRQVGGYVKAQGAEASNALAGAGAQFQDDVKKNTMALDQGILDQAIADPTKVAGDAAQKQSLLKMRDAEYKGPKSLESVDYFNPVMNAVSKAKQSANNTASVQGRNALLTDVQNQNKQRSTAGGATLDSAILGTSADAKKTLGRARENVAGVDKQLQATQQSTSDAATQAQTQTEDVKNKVRAALGQSVGDFTTGLQKRVGDTATAQKTSYDALVNDLKSGRPSAKNLDKFGLKTGDKLWGSDLNPFVSQTEAADAGSVANADDYARYAALAELSGTDPGLLKQTDLGRAGTANSTGYKVNTDALKTDLAQKQQDYEQEANPIIAQLEQIQNAGSTSKSSEDIQKRVAATRALKKQLAEIQAKHQYGDSVQALNPGRMARAKLTPIK